jgi:ABC-type cobalamin/Fe3+-siderophores transport system ATPase subunit
VNRNEKIALIGHNGFGKTTMLKALLRCAGRRPVAIRLDSGSVRWGHEV